MLTLLEMVKGLLPLRSMESALLRMRTVSQAAAMTPDFPFLGADLSISL